MKTLAGAAAVALALIAAPVAAQAPTNLLNVSYDIAREVYADINAAFIPAYEAETGIRLTVDQSHAGSSAQARSVLEGLQADIVTFNQVTDIQVLADAGYVAADWQSALPNNSSPYYSLPAFLVRAGNPKNIRNWDDLARDDVQVIFPNPKTSGNARYTYLAATAFAREVFDNDPAQVAAFVRKIFANVPVFDTGGRAATATFVERGLGDVLITFEAEVHGIRRTAGEDKFEAVVPEVSLLAEFPVAVVERVVDARGSRAPAEAYLEFLYSPEGQDVVARHFNRTTNEEVSARYADLFPPVRLVTVEDVFGGWDQVTEEHFAEGGLLDKAFVNQ